MRAEDPFAAVDAMEPGERGRVVRVFDGDALVLESGQSVRLIGIEAPAGPYRDRAGEPGHDIATRMLEDMVLGREVELRYAGLTRDRFDRALAHVVTTDELGPRLWLNAEMVGRGGARVRIYADTAAGSDLLLAREAEARSEGHGLWGKEGIWQVHDATRLPEGFARFQMVTGEVADMRGSGGRGTVCELSLSDSLLVLEIETPAAALCQLPRGSRIRARGYVREGRMEITHELSVETLAAPNGT